MWRSINISNKIWLSLGILLAGYFLSIAFGFLSGINTESRLISVYTYLFPASHKSQSALTAFDNQINHYQDAYLTGDADLVANAEAEAARAQENLQEIVRLARQQQQPVGEVMALVEALRQFNDQARTVYTDAITQSQATVPTTLNSQQSIFTLAQKTDQLGDRLTALRDGFNTQLENELSAIVLFSKQQRLGNVFLFIAITVVSIIFIRFMVRWSITNPLKEAVFMVKDIADGKGDLTKRLTVKYHDEVGELAGWFNVFIKNMQEMTRDIINNAASLRDSATNLSQVSGQMNQNAEQMVNKTNSVTAAVEEMDASMGTIAVSMEQATTNTDTVASSTEEMSATINEIAQSAQNASSITRKAVTQSEQASRRVTELGAAADEIGKVTETINEISEQTNLLALNATIEAARAGEAGKGFAVVADEIKELARQTAEATLDIKDKINSIQNTTSGTVQDIGDISGIINTVNETVTIIASSVEEQSASTREIASNVSEISKAIGDVNDNVAQSSSATSEIAQDVANVNQRASDVSSNSTQLNNNADKLSELADNLYQLMAKFKV